MIPKLADNETLLHSFPSEGGHPWLGNWQDVPDKSWARINQHVPKRKRSRTGGRPPLDDRQGFEGIWWMRWTGTPWDRLPTRAGSKNDVHRRLQAWAVSEVLLTLWRALLDQRSDHQ